MSVRTGSITCQRLLGFVGILLALSASVPAFDLGDPVEEGDNACVWSITFPTENLHILKTNDVQCKGKAPGPNLAYDVVITDNASNSNAVTGSSDPDGTNCPKWEVVVGKPSPPNVWAVGDAAVELKVGGVREASVSIKFD